MASALSSESLAGNIVLCVVCVSSPSIFVLDTLGCWPCPWPCPCAFNVSVGLLDESSVGCGAQAAGELMCAGDFHCCRTEEGQILTQITR